jgi:hypothetical protein
MMCPFKTTGSQIMKFTFTRHDPDGKSKELTGVLGYHGSWFPGHTEIAMFLDV